MVIALLAFGLLVRLRFGTASGTIDMEYWKAWSSYALYDFTAIYGDSDAEILPHLKAGWSLSELREEHARKVEFASVDTKQKEFWVSQPPLYLAACGAAGAVYRLFSGGLENTPWFNFCLNLLNLLSAAVITWLIVRFFERQGRPALGWPTALAFWLNPLVLLNAPVQGYLDQMCAVWLVASMAMLFERRLVLAYALFAAAVLSKPTAVLAAPVLVAFGLLEHPWKRSLVGAGVAGGIGFANWLPFWLAGYGLSPILGISQLGAQLMWLSRKAIGPWRLVEQGISSDVGNPWTRHYQGEFVTHVLGFSPDALGNALFVGFTLLNLGAALALRHKDRTVMLSAAGLQFLGSYALRTGQHVNHYFLAIPLLAMLALTTRLRAVTFFVSCAIFFGADVLFYGFGRDFLLERDRGIGSWVAALSWASSIALPCLFAAAYAGLGLLPLLRQWLSARRWHLAAVSAGVAFYFGLTAWYARSHLDPAFAELAREFAVGTPPTNLADHAKVKGAHAEHRGESALLVDATDPGARVEVRTRLPKRARQFVLRVVVTASESAELVLPTFPDGEGGRKYALASGRNELYAGLSKDQASGKFGLGFEGPGRYLISSLELSGVRPRARISTP